MERAVSRQFAQRVSGFAVILNRTGELLDPLFDFQPLFGFLCVRCIEPIFVAPRGRDFSRDQHDADDVRR